MAQDLNKGIQANGISYNYLNLPVEIKINNSDADKINYIYDASGTKLQKAVTEGGSVTSVTDYAGNYIYEDTGSGPKLQFFNHAEGYVDAEGTGYNYVYQYKDHLGNVRLSYQDADSDGSITTDEIVEESNYYPFGLKHMGYGPATSSLGNSVAQRWKYNGKEYDESLNINTYDFGARNYDPALGRWMNLDPLAEQMRRHSPYNYAFDNPIYFIDPDGMAPFGPGDPPINGEGIARAVRSKINEINKTAEDVAESAFLLAVGPLVAVADKIKNGGGYAFGAESGARGESISEEKDRKAKGDTEMIDVSSVIFLSAAKGPGFSNKLAEGTRIASDIAENLIEPNEESSNVKNGSIDNNKDDEVKKTTTAKISRINRVDKPSYSSGGGRNGTRIQVVTKDTTINAEDSLKIVIENRNKIQSQKDSIYEIYGH